MSPVVHQPVHLFKIELSQHCIPSYQDKLISIAESLEESGVHLPVIPGLEVFEREISELRLSDVELRVANWEFGSPGLLIPLARHVLEELVSYEQCLDQTSSVWTIDVLEDCEEVYLLRSGFAECPEPEESRHVSCRPAAVIHLSDKLHHRSDIYQLAKIIQVS